MQSLVFSDEDNFKDNFKEDLQFNSGKLYAVRRKLSGLGSLRCIRIAGAVSILT